MALNSNVDRVQSRSQNKRSSSHNNNLPAPNSNNSMQATNMAAQPLQPQKQPSSSRRFMAGSQGSQASGLEDENRNRLHLIG